MKKLALTLLAMSLLAGCTVGPNYQRPPITSPEQVRGQIGPVEPSSLADRSWWDLFQDDVLKSLIGEALQNGFDVRLAAWRVEEAKADAGIARSEYFPQIQAGAGVSRSRASEVSVPGSAPINLGEVNLGLSWEVDLWGRIRRLNESARAEYLASEEARRGVLLSLTSEVATTYFQLRALDLQLEIAHRTAEAFQGTYDLFNRRLEGGLASALETSSAESSLAATSATIPNLERQIVEQENRLAFLLGQNPGPIARGETLNDQLLPPEVPPGLPSDLLQRRPDLLEAEQRLVAANANVGVTVANFFPTLSLTGAFGGVATQVSDLFGRGKVWSVGGSLLSPVFQGRRLKNEHHAAIAEWEQAKVQYERSVTNAFSEVSTALVAYQKLVDVEKEQARAVAAETEAVRLSNERYRAGLADYLEVLDAQQKLFPAENFLAQTRFERLSSLIQLYKALGGGWSLSDQQWSGPEKQAASLRLSRP